MNRIKFLGTAGARFVVSKQVRKSGGIWLTLNDTDVLIDPGPGSLVRALSSRPKLNPMDLDGIILTHRHIDHSNDVNIMIEAMTDGGSKKKGVVFAPSDAVEGEDPVILNHFKDHVESIEVLEEGGSYTLGDISFSTPVKHVHGVETYGLNVCGGGHFISFVADTKYFDGLESYYEGDVLVLNVVSVKSRENVLHLSVGDAEKMISSNKPSLSILTHFGMTMIKEKPWLVAEGLSDKLGVEVMAASDGRNIKLDEYIK